MATLPVVARRSQEARSPPRPEPPILRQSDRVNGYRQPPTVPFTPRSAGSYHNSARPYTTWLRGPASDDSRSSTVHGQRVTRRFFLGNGALQPDRAQGRERVVEKTTIGCPKHYDVIVDAEDGVEYTGDHVRYRYVDFLTSRPLDDSGAAAQKLDSIQSIAEWLDTSHPYTRLDAYPLFILAKDVIRRLMRHELHSHDNEKIRIALELSQLRAKLEELTRTTSEQLADLRKRYEDATKENERLNDLKLDAEKQWAALQADFENHKLTTQQAADAHSKHLSELTRTMENEQRQHEVAHSKLKQELEAAHTYDETAVKVTLQRVLNDLDDFNADGRDHHADKLLLLRRLCCTFSQQEHPDVLKAFFFSLGEFDVSQLPSVLTDGQCAALLQSLLDKADPKAPLEHLEAGSTELTDAMTALLREALAKGCDSDSLLAPLLAELGREALLAKLRGDVVDVGTQCEALSQPELEPKPELQPELAKPELGRDLAERERAVPAISKDLLFMHKEHKEIPALNLMKAHSMIGDIYEQKALADDTDDANNHRRNAMPEFLRLWSLHSFGLRKIANERLAALVKTVRENAALEQSQTDYDIRLQTFGWISGILTPPHEHTELPANFCVDLLRRCVARQRLEMIPLNFCSKLTNILT